MGKDSVRQDGGPGGLSASEPEPGSHLGLTIQCQQLWGATHWGPSQAVQVSSEKHRPPTRVGLNEGVLCRTGVSPAQRRASEAALGKSPGC